SDGRNVVLRLTGGDACVAPRADAQVDHHSPLGPGRRLIGVQTEIRFAARFVRGGNMAASQVVLSDRSNQIAIFHQLMWLSDRERDSLAGRFDLGSQRRPDVVDRLQGRNVDSDIGSMPPRAASTMT